MTTWIKTLFAAIALLFVVSFAEAEDLKFAGLTLEYDKMLHFSAGYIISDAVFHIQKSDDILLPILIPAAIGAGKELLIDSEFDWRDFGYTVAGAVVRTTLRVTIKF